MKWFNLSNTKQLMHLYCFLIVIGRITIKIEQRKSKGWGRFGGGWNWVLGIQVGSTSLIINLIILSIRISYIKKVVK